MSEIDALIDKINKRLKSDVLVYADKLQTFQRTSTGSLSFDLMLGGGWPLNAGTRSSAWSPTARP